MSFRSDSLRRMGVWGGRGLAWGMLALAGLGIAAASLGLRCSFIERLTHMRFYWIGVLALLLAGWLGRKRWFPATLALGLLLMGVPELRSYYRQGAADPPAVVAGEGRIAVGAWNVHSSNPERGRCLPWLADCGLDVLLLTEVNPGWVKHLKETALRWPHQICEPRNGAAGIWLLSRWPLSSIQQEGIAAEEERPWIACTVETPAGNIMIFGMHPRTPRGGSRFHERNAQLDRAAAFAAASPGPVIVLGDLNCTPFSPWFDRLLENGRLADSAAGYGLTPTWRSGIWRLPLDHILIGGPLTVVDRKVHEDNFGSDHSPVTVVLTGSK